MNIKIRDEEKEYNNYVKEVRKKLINLTKRSLNYASYNGCESYQDLCDLLSVEKSINNVKKRFNVVNENLEHILARIINNQGNVLLKYFYRGNRLCIIVEIINNKDSKILYLIKEQDKFVLVDENDMDGNLICEYFNYIKDIFSEEYFPKEYFDNKNLQIDDSQIDLVISNEGIMLDTFHALNVAVFHKNDFLIKEFNVYRENLLRNTLVDYKFVCHFCPDVSVANGKKILRKGLYLCQK